MKSIIALLLGVTLTYAALPTNPSPPQPELDWDDDQEAASSEKEYKGLIVQVYRDDDGQPTVALGSEQDDFDLAYCLNLVALFQASDYDTLTAEYTMVADSYEDLTNCSVRETSTTSFNIACDVQTDATLSLTFTFTTDTQGDNGLEYIISLNGYELPTNTTKLVLVQSLEVCSDEYSLDSWDASEESQDDGESDNDDDDEGESDNDTEGEEDVDDNDGEQDDGDDRRRLIRGEGDEDDEESQNDDDDDDDDDDQSVEDDDESSSDESGEIDVGFSRFVSNGQAVDKCNAEDVRNIDSEVVNQVTLKQVHLVFDYFECELILDPFYGLDDSKYAQAFPENLNKDKAYSLQITIALIVSIIAIIFIY